MEGLGPKFQVYHGFGPKISGVSRYAWVLGASWGGLGGPSVPPHPVLVPTLRPEGVGFSQGVVPEPVQKGTMPVQPSVLPPSVQPSVLPPSVLVPTLRQCEARDSKAEQLTMAPVLQAAVVTVDRQNPAMQATKLC